MAFSAHSSSAYSNLHIANRQAAPTASFAIDESRPVDMVHLSRQSLGDRALENEILSLFQSQSALYLDRLLNAKSADERRMASHTILGSARGIGAWRVAEEAQRIELAAGVGPDCSRLKEAVEAANAYISEMMDD